MLHDFRDVVVVGAEHSTLNNVVVTAAQAMGLEVTPDPTPEEVLFARGDHYSFVKQGVPAVFPSVRFTKAVYSKINALAEFLARHEALPSAQRRFDPAARHSCSGERREISISSWVSSCKRSCQTEMESG